MTSSNDAPDSRGWITMTEMTWDNCDMTPDGQDDSVSSVGSNGGFFSVAGCPVEGEAEWDSGLTRISQNPRQLERVDSHITSSTPSLKVQRQPDSDRQPSVHSQQAHRGLESRGSFLPPPSPSSSQPSAFITQTPRSHLPRHLENIITSSCLSDLFPSVLNNMPGEEVAKWVDTCQKYADKSYFSDPRHKTAQ